MKNFETKFYEYLREQGYECGEATREAEDWDEQIKKQRTKLDSMQREEALRIYEEFFENADEMEVSDSLYPVLKVRSEVMVHHLVSKKLAYVTYNAETMISKRFDEMKIGGEFNVNVEYLGTYDRGMQVSVDSDSASAMDCCLVTIELELF